MASSKYMKQILSITQTISEEFQLPGGNSFITLAVHSGGTWKLQMKTPDDEWIAFDDVIFAAAGQKAFVSVFGPMYRVTGGTVGAKAWISTNVYQPGLLG